MSAPPANTPACFSEFIGQRVVGVLFNALPANRRDLASGTKTLVFEDGRGLTVASNGSYWIDSAAQVRRAVAVAERDLRATEASLAGVLALAQGFRLGLDEAWPRAQRNDPQP